MPQDGDGLVSYPLKAVLEGPQATREEGDGRTIVVPVARIIDMRTVPDGYEPRHRD
jgi:nitrogen regulatory protein PII